nr:hypothetical protein [Rickettsia endosymbiont of Ceutorhynchus assimilis]
MQYSFLTNLTKLPFIKEIWLFGSRARGEDAKRVFENIKLYLPILEKTYNKLEKKYFG